MYDLMIIGAGAAGVACAQYALQNGLHIALVENDSNCFGGICLNRGCIPTKFFISESKNNNDWSVISRKKNEIVEKIKTPLLHYLGKNNVDIIWGKGTFVDKNTLLVDSKKISAQNIIVATGSSPQRIQCQFSAIYAEEFFNLSGLGNKFLIVGGGYIGIEFASLLNNLGKEVVLIEKEQRILPFLDSYFSQRLKIILQKKGIQICVGADMANFDAAAFDNVIMCVGRRPNSDLGLKNAGVVFDEKGWIKTDSFMRTNIENIYACGDVTGKKLLAYTAEYQAKICIDGIMGKTMSEDYWGIPECVFSLPQVATVGILGDEAKKRNISCEVIRSNFLKFSSAHVYGDSDGFIEIIIDTHNQCVIGAGIISQNACELISVLSVYVKNKFPVESLRNSVFVHPTLSEIIPSVLRKV